MGVPGQSEDSSVGGAGKTVAESYVFLTRLECSLSASLVSSVVL